MSERHIESSARDVEEITVREAFARLSVTQQEPPLLVDVREAWEYASGHARGAINVPLSMFAQRSSELPRDRELLFICHVGQRSMKAAKYMRGQGAARVANLDGGTDAWEQAKLPMEHGAQ